VSELIRHGGPYSSDPLKFKVSQPERLVPGKPMVE
jgi:xylose isomerase